MNIDQNFVNESLKAHFKAAPTGPERWRGVFEQQQCVNLGPSFMPQGLQAALHQEARRLLSEAAERRSVTIESTGHTPRSYRSVGRDAIKKSGTLIPALFESDVLLDLLRVIAGEPVHRVPYAPEEYIINNQSSTGDTHGWHWDDYAFALIHIVEAPNPFLGGRIEYIPDVVWRKQDSEECIRSALQERIVTSMHVGAGETYFMRTNTTLHRVSPLVQKTNRVAVIYSFASESDLSDPSIGHDTMEKIYPRDTGSHAGLPA